MSPEMFEICFEAASTFPLRMDANELLKECQRWIDVDKRIWISPERFRLLIVKTESVRYHKDTKSYWNLVRPHNQSDKASTALR